MAEVKLGVLISGGGSNLQAIIDSCKDGILTNIAKVSVVISNKQDAYGLKRAEQNGINALYINPKDYDDNKEYCAKISKVLKENGVVLVCLAGYMKMIDPGLIEGFLGNIINIHPALLPKYGGKGMYGHFVHEAVIKAHEKESGATVHWVDEHYDHGPAIMQEKVEVLEKDTPEELAKRVLAVEHKIYPEAIFKIINEGLSNKN